MLRLVCLSNVIKKDIYSFLHCLNLDSLDFRIFLIDFQNQVRALFFTKSQQKEACGVFFVNQETNERVKVSSKIPVNKPSELMVVIPALAAGAYKLEVATQFTGGTKTLLKEPRKAVFERILTVL